MSPVIAKNQLPGFLFISGSQEGILQAELKL